MDQRKKNFENYIKLFNDVKLDTVSFPKYEKKNNPSFHLFLININFEMLKINKDQLIRRLNKKNIFPQFHYIPLYKFSIVNNKSKFKDSENYFKNTMSLPIYVGLTKKEQVYIVNNLSKIIILNAK